MSKSEVLALQGVMHAILDDYVQYYPADTREVERDINRLTHLVKERGLGVFLLDLPSMGKHFDRCLANGALSNPNLPLQGRRWKGSPIPRLFSGLMIRVFDRTSGCLLDDADTNVVGFLRNLYNFAGKYKYECDRKRTVDTVRDFYRIEREIRSPSLNWDDDYIDLRGSGHLDFLDVHIHEDLPLFSEFSDRGESGIPDSVFRTLQLAADLFAASIGEFRAEDWKPRHGPGAVSDLPGKDSKFLFPNWPDKLDFAFPMSEFGFLNYDYWLSEVERPTGNFKFHEPPSKLIAVPKTAKGPRLIAAEPVAFQWCQQMILDYLKAGLKGSFLQSSIVLEDQKVSGDLALRASLDGDLATIDLSAASDRISPWLIERLFRKNSSLLRALHASRSRWIVNTITRDDDGSLPRFHKLRKFSTMGSACTFPVQSILFALVTIACVAHSGHPSRIVSRIKKAAREVQVYGDDIIVPTEHYGLVMLTLEKLGLRVNPDKSFGTGRFRESCGMDAFRGFNVTPVRVNSIVDISRPSTIASAIDVANNFFVKGLWQSMRYVESTLPKWVLNGLASVPIVSGILGRASFCGFHPTPQQRWNDNLQRLEFRSFKLVSNEKKWPQLGHHDLFQYFTDRPEPTSKWDPGRGRRTAPILRRSWEPMDQLHNMWLPRGSGASA